MYVYMCVYRHVCGVCTFDPSSVANGRNPRVSPRRTTPHPSQTHTHTPNSPKKQKPQAFCSRTLAAGPFKGLGQGAPLRPLAYLLTLLAEFAAAAAAGDEAIEGEEEGWRGGGSGRWVVVEEEEEEEEGQEEEEEEAPLLPPPLLPPPRSESRLPSFVSKPIPTPVPKPPPPQTSHHK
jgi:hypothetical protein